jgi:hypothetical protein
MSFVAMKRRVMGKFELTPNVALSLVESMASLE